VIPHLTASTLLSSTTDTAARALANCNPPDNRPVPRVQSLNIRMDPELQVSIKLNLAVCSTPRSAGADVLV
jgi:hypothetical protein